jgi:hypothetical protein
MNESRQLADRTGVIVETMMLIVLAPTLLLGPAILVWSRMGYAHAIPVSILCLWLWLPGIKRAWRSIGQSKMFDADSLFGASFECPRCKRVRYHKERCKCGHEVKKLEWDGDRLKCVE